MYLTVLLLSEGYAVFAMARTGRCHVLVDPEFFRPGRPPSAGDAHEAREVLGWEPKTGFRGIVSMMVDADLQRLSA